MKEQMPKHDFAAGVVVFHTDTGGERTYLVIRNVGGHWELPKGHAELGETWQQTALRELREETGIVDIELIPGFAMQIRYVFRDRKKEIVHKVVQFALGRTDSTSIHLSDEHTDFALLPFAPAMNRLTHAATRALLTDAETFLKQNADVLQSARGE